MPQSAAVLRPTYGNPAYQESSGEIVASRTRRDSQVPLSPQSIFVNHAPLTAQIARPPARSSEPRITERPPSRGSRAVNALYFVLATGAFAAGFSAVMALFG